MRTWIKAQTEQAILSANVYKQACKMAAQKDGEIDNYEKKKLKSIEKAVERYITDLNKILK